MTASPPVDPSGVLEFANPGNAGHLSRLHKQGRAIKLAPSIYVRDAALPATALTRTHLWAIVAHLWPGAVICDRSALAGAVGPWIFLCHPEPPRGSDLVLPGFTVTCRRGPGPLPDDMPWMLEGLHISGVARGLIENADVTGRPPKNRPHRASGLTAVGERIAELAASGGHDRLSAVFAEFDRIRGYFPTAAVESVRTLLAAVQGTYQGQEIASERLAAQMIGTPYDPARVALFDRITEDLSRLAPQIRPVPPTGSSRWLPFFEAYFSNYIEGTRFSVEEAFAIAINNEIPPARPADAHDITATYQIVNDPRLMSETPRDAQEFLTLLRARHHVLMGGRPDKNPGVFKTRQNYAGTTAFVAPAHVDGTLREGWDRIANTVDPFHRAVLMMFVVSECHPFDDGNGRIARIMTNAELAARGQHRIIIASSYRNNYLAALNAATNNNGIQAVVSVLDFARQWVAAIDWDDWDRCMAGLDQSNAFVDPGVAELSGQRLRLPDRR